MDLIEQAPVSVQPAIQAPDPAPAESTEPAPAPEAGHAPPAPETAAPKAPPAPQDEAFFDRKQFEEDLAKVDPAVAPHVKNLYHQLNRAFTQKTQAIASERQKVEAYNSFMESFQRNPVAAIRDLSLSLGITPAQANAMIQNAQGAPRPADAEPPDGVFQTREELSAWVKKQAKEEAEAMLREQMAPMVKSMQDNQAKAVEAQLNDIDPQWLVYEDQMRENLKRHPSLANDLPTLYRISVPEDVHQKRAQAAERRRMEADREAARVSGQSTVRASTAAVPEVRSFDDAVKAARKSLGIA